MNNIIFYISISIHIFFIILFYIIYIYGIGNCCKDFPIYNKILLSNIINDCKSGDLLLFSNIRCNVLTRTIGNPYFSHIGIIIKKMNILYVLELVLNDHIYPNQPKQQNLILTPLNDRIRYYSGYIFYCKLLNRLSIDKEQQLLNISNIHQKFSPLNNCGYFIGKTLEDLQIATNIISSKFWTIHNNIVNLCDDTIYTIPINIISDELLINNINNNKLLNHC